MNTAGPRDGFHQCVVIYWLILFITANLLIAEVAPRLQMQLPHRNSPYRNEAIGDVFGRNFESIFQTHSISDPREPGAVRLVAVGNSQLANPLFVGAMQHILRMDAPNIEYYSLAWPGLNISGQASFVLRSLQENPDVILWAVAPIDCSPASPPLAPSAPLLSVQYGKGLASAVANFRYATLDNVRDVLYNLLGEILPYVRHLGTLRQMTPRLPELVLPRLDSGADRISEHEPFVPPSEIRFPPDLYPPTTAVKGLTELLPHTNTAGASLIVLIMPHCYVDALYGPGNFDRFVEHIKRWTSLNGVPLIDLSTSVPDNAFYDSVHFSPAYYDDVTAHLCKEIISAMRASH
jgi:hypothetical protein